MLILITKSIEKMKVTLAAKGQFNFRQRIKFCLINAAENGLAHEGAG
jgi:hypothetical protein